MTIFLVVKSVDIHENHDMTSAFIVAGIMFIIAISIAWSIWEVRPSARGGVRIPKYHESQNLKGLKMTKGELDKQRVSFVYGNLKIENELITREMIEEAAETVDKKKNER